MIILGIDPGIALAGWAILKQEKKENPQLVDYGCIETKSSQGQDERLLQIFVDLEKVIRKYQPDVLCLEKLFFNTNTKTALIVGEARGVIRICATLNKIPITEFTPLQIKNAIVGYGRADKNQVQQMVKVLLKLKEIPQPDDAADAVAAGLTYCSTMK